ncbi:unnamed protein product [Parajaminaea phylloscopi]
MPSLALYTVASAATQKDLDGILADVRSTGYIAEITSNEVSPQESGLWDAVVPVRIEDLGQKSDDARIKELVKLTASGRKGECVERLDVPAGLDLADTGFVVVDEETLKGDGSLLVVQIDPSRAAEVSRLRVVPRSLIEVASNIAVSNMALSEFKDMCGAEVYDAGQ